MIVNISHMDNLSEDELKTSCSNTGGGAYCAERIRRNGWKID